MRSDAEKTIRDSFAAWNSHDVDEIASFYADDCIHEDVALGAVYHGKKELETSISGLFVWSPDVKFELKSCFGANHWVASEWVMSGTHAGIVPGIPATGKSFSIRGASIYELRKGRISRDCDYWNLASFLQQVGLMPEAPLK